MKRTHAIPVLWFLLTACPEPPKPATPAPPKEQGKGAKTSTAAAPKATYVGKPGQRWTEDFVIEGVGDDKGGDCAAAESRAKVLVQEGVAELLSELSTHNIAIPATESEGEFELPAIRPDSQEKGPDGACWVLASLDVIEAFNLSLSADQVPMKARKEFLEKVGQVFEDIRRKKK